jgi:hypothetical protein
MISFVTSRGLVLWHSLVRLSFLVCLRSSHIVSLILLFSMIAVRAGLDDTPLALACLYRQANPVTLEVRGALNSGYQNS